MEFNYISIIHMAKHICYHIYWKNNDIIKLIIIIYSTLKI